MRNTAKRIKVHPRFFVEVEVVAYAGAKDPQQAEIDFIIKAEDMAHGICAFRSARHGVKPKDQAGHWYTREISQQAGPCFHAMTGISFIEQADADQYALHLPELAKRCRVKIN